MNPRRALVIVNPSARGGRGARALARLRGDSRVIAEWVDSQDAADLVARVAAAQDGGYDAVAVAGGDGTVTLALEGLRAGQRAPLAILPIGSGNDFARDCGVPATIEAAWATLASGVARTVDVAEAGQGGPRFGCVGSVGLDEMALRVLYASRWPRSKALNIYSALRGLAAYEPREVAVTWAGGAFRGPVMFVATMNTRSYGGGFRVTPTARIDDGALDLCIVRASGKFRLMRQLPRMLRGTHVDLPEVVMARSSWVRVEEVHASPLTVCLDGELDLARTPIEFRCLPRALSVLVTEGSS